MSDLGGGVCLFLFFVMLGTEPRTLYVLGEYAMELHS